MIARRASRTAFRGIFRVAAFAWLASSTFALQPGVLRAAPPAPASASASASASVAAQPSGEPGQKPRSPAVIDDARFDLHLTLVAEGADICVVLPENREDPDACAGLDVQAMRKGVTQMADKPMGVALFRFEGWASLLVVAQSPGNARVWSDRDMADFVRGVRDGLREDAPDAVVSGADPAAAYDAVDLQGHRAVRYFADLRVAKDAPNVAVSRSTGYGVVTDGAILQASFMGPPEHDAEVRRVAESTMATLRLRPPKPGAQLGPDWYAVARHLVTAVIALGPIIGLIVGLVVLAKSRRKTPPRP